MPTVPKVNQSMLTVVKWLLKDPIYSFIVYFIMPLNCTHVLHGLELSVSDNCKFCLCAFHRLGL